MEQDKTFMPLNIKIILINKINKEYNMRDDLKKFFIQQIKGYNELNDEKKEKIFELIKLTRYLN